MTQESDSAAYRLLRGTRTGRPKTSTHETTTMPHTRDSDDNGLRQYCPGHGVPTPKRVYKQWVNSGPKRAPQEQWESSREPQASKEMQVTLLLTREPGFKKSSHTVCDVDARGPRRLPPATHQDFLHEAVGPEVRSGAAPPAGVPPESMAFQPKEVKEEFEKRKGLRPNTQPAGNQGHLQRGDAGRQQPRADQL